MYYIYELGDDTMKIVKYKKSTKGRYKVITDDGRELLLYEEVILKYDLLIKKEIDDNVLVEMDQYNQEWDVYYTALNMIRNRIRSSYELKELLLRKEYPSDLVLKAISKLEEQGYLNDLGYAKSYVAHYINSNRGPFKIAKELREKHITEENISLALTAYSDEEQVIKIKKAIEKGIKTNHSKGGVVLKQKIYQELKLAGYDISLINQVISSYSFPVDEKLVKKEYDKLYRSLSRKYKGEELERKIREKLFSKGLKYDK